eukprot:758865-Hanusia_phi.AAC.6
MMVNHRTFVFATENSVRGGIVDMKRLVRALSDCVQFSVLLSWICVTINLSLRCTVIENGCEDINSAALVPHYIISSLGIRTRYLNCLADSQAVISGILSLFSLCQTSPLLPAQADEEEINHMQFPVANIEEDGNEQNKSPAAEDENDTLYLIPSGEDQSILKVILIMDIHFILFDILQNSSVEPEQRLHLSVATQANQLGPFDLVFERLRVLKANGDIPPNILQESLGSKATFQWIEIFFQVAKLVMVILEAGETL